MASYMDPFSEKTFKSIYDPWIRIINQKESATVIHLPKRDQLYRVNQFVQNISQFQSRFIDCSSLQFITLDLDSLAIDDAKELQLHLDTLLLRNKRPVILILDSDKLIIDKQTILSYIDTLHHEISASVFYLFSKNIYFDKYICYIGQFTSLLQNPIIFPYFDRLDSKKFIRFLSKDFCILPTKVIQNVFDSCGGCMWIIKEAVRYYCQRKNEIDIFDHFEMKIKIRILLQELEPEEREVLQRIALKDYDFEEKHKPYLDYLLKTKTIQNHGKTFKNAISLLEQEIIREIKLKSRLMIGRSNNIELNSVPVDLLFSKSEKRLLRYLITNINNICSREKAAELLWNEKQQNNYSDWAIDQAIWRIRKKLAKLNIDPKIIQTVKNKGFILKQ